MHLAQINIGRLVVSQLDPINKLAEESPGFVWRLQSAAGNATDVAYNDDPLMIVNMSVWESLDALKNYVYRSQHIGVLKDRKQWFEKMDLPRYCLWWIPAPVEESVPV